MKSFKLFWTAHKWTGIVLSAVLLCSAATGFLLIIKKRVDWIQPPSREGAPGEIAAFIPIGAAIDAAIDAGHPALTSVEDVDRIDVRPGRRLYKIQSKREHVEVQVCAVTGAVLSIAVRRSDLIENIHDGSFFAGWVHDWIMPVASAGLVFLVGSGLWLWVEPKMRRRRRRRRQRALP